ncbi:barstar family protein [Anaerospora sp.]|uniref:barstar family protein n=1 Tax=Anaerospora sp. TaxID=1960278 RepID=UPI0028978F31|nr:barstar family protein [Anaerospora sp.]
MNKQMVTLDGSQFNNIEEFYCEIGRVFTSNLTWEIGCNLDAFNDVLYGGFGVHECGESLTIIWQNSCKSKLDLGHSATVQYYEKMLITCHPTNKQKVKIRLDEARRGRGSTLFDQIIEIIQSHDHVKLILS